jgi:DNA-binding transcriptional MocR family regulator
MPLISRTHVDRMKSVLPTLSNSPSLDHIFANRPVPGIMVHRETGVQWVANRGIEVSADEVLVTNGAAHALWACLATLGDPAHPVATESLVDNAVITNASILRLPLKGLELDEEGIVPESLDRLCNTQDVRILVTSPDYNNPTASLMGLKRRESIADLARKHDLSIIEFDCYGALIEDQLPTLFSLAPERTYYATGYSLTVMSALRTGFIATPPRQASRIRSRLRATGWMANTISAEIATRWTNDGTLDELVGIQRSHLKQRHLILQEALSGCQVQSHPTAPFAWMELPEHWSPKAFVDYAYRHAIRVTPPLPFSVTGDDKSRAVRISLGGSTQDDTVLQRALSELSHLANDHPDPLDYRY